MTDRISGSASLSSLEKIPKLSGTKGYLAWKRSMRDCLKMLRLWKYVAGTAVEPVVGEPATEAQAASSNASTDGAQNDLTKAQTKALNTYRDGVDQACTALRLACAGNAYTRIENLENPCAAWKLLEKTYTPKGAGFLNEACRQLFTLTLANCSSSEDYVTRFQDAVNNLQSFSSGLILDENILKYFFHANLGSDHESYVERYAQDHEPFALDGTAKHSLSEAMEHFENTAVNPKTTGGAVVSMAAVHSAGGRGRGRGRGGHGGGSGRTSNPETVQPTANGMAVVSKTVKYCNHCKKPYHMESECRVKYPHLAAQADQRPRKRPRNDDDSSAKPSGDNDTAKSAYVAFMACDSPIKEMAKLWVWDCGNSQHISHDRAAFTQLTEKTLAPIQGIGGALTPRGIGTVTLSCLDGQGNSRPFPLFNVLYVPEGGLNLISQGQLQREGCPMKIVPQGIEIGQFGIMARRQENNLYILDLFNVPQSAVALAAVNSEALKMWHARLGHLGEQNVTKLASMSQGMDLTKPPPKDACEPCAIAQTTVEPHKAPMEPGKHPLDLIHSDVQGPFKEAPNGAKYLVTFHCDFERRSHVALLRAKSGVFQAFQNYKKQNEYGDRRIKRLRSDNGGEYNSTEFNKFRFDNGIQWEPNIPGNPEQNGKAERLGQTLHRIASTMRVEAKLDEKWWAELVLTANYLRNRQPTAGRNVTPYETHTGSPPQLGHLRIIGQTGYAQVRKPSTGWKKFQDRAIKCTLVGYEGDHIYRMITPKGVVMRYSNVKWINNASASLPSAPSNPRIPSTPPVPPLSSSSPRVIEIEDDDPPPNKKQKTSPNDAAEAAVLEFLDTINVPDTDPIAPKVIVPEAPPPSPKAVWQRAPPSPKSAPGPPRFEVLARHPELRECSPDPLAMLALLAHAASIEPYEPKTYRQATRCPDHRQWQKGMQDEIDAVNANFTYKLVFLPPNRRALRAKWVYRIKRGAMGEILRHKARWVVRGFEQREGIDFNETFASVVKPMSYRALFALAAAHDWEIHAMDVKTAFLYGTVEEDIYVEQPEGFEDGSERVCKLNKALYGLKQSPRIWYETLTTFLKSLGYSKIDADFSIFAKDGTIVSIYVDDLKITGSSMTDINFLKQALSKRFQMVDLGPISYYLGISITRDRPNRILRLSQQTYLEKVLRDHGMWESKPVATPMEGRLEAGPEGFQATDDSRLRYQSAVGSLMYAMLGTRPDLAFSVSVVSRYSSNPTDTHWTAVKRIFRYIKGTLTLELTFSGPLMSLSGYTDADWAGDVDTRRSTSGYVFNIGSGAISWSSKRQPTVALSSCEAEYMGQTQATKEAIWLSALLDQLNPPEAPGANTVQMTANNANVALACLPTSFSFGAVIIHCDNQGAIALAKNPQAHTRSKHINTHWHYQRERIEDGSVEFKYVPTEEQVADGLTKALPKDKFLAFRKALGLE